MSRIPALSFLHLGCEKNRVDTEHMMGLLDEAGFRLEENSAQADYVVVNTCSFIAAAREESVRTLMELEAAGKRVIITGCMAQHFRDELLKEIPSAAAVVGTGDYDKIVEIVKRIENGERVSAVSEKPSFLADEKTPRLRGEKPFAFVRVAEGCDYSCSYCVIPQLRGKQRSRPIESIVKEARELASAGVKELVLIAQNTTSYGTDLYGKPSLVELLRALSTVNVPWIRVHYAYPTGMTSELLDVIQASGNILPYFDIPLQHAHPEILKAMNRPWQAETNDKIIERIRERIPGAILRTTFIVGFPGETAKHFEYLHDFVVRSEFDHLGVFCFSPEEGTAAFSLPKRVSQKTMEKRKDALMAAQQGISLKRNRAQIGSQVDVLIEGQEQDETGRRFLVGRSARFAPDVDGIVMVSGEAPLGSLARVLITDAEIYDLHGEVIKA